MPKAGLMANNCGCWLHHEWHPAHKLAQTAPKFTQTGCSWMRRILGDRLTHAKVDWTEVKLVLMNHKRLTSLRKISNWYARYWQKMPERCLHNWQHSAPEWHRFSGTIKYHKTHLVSGHYFMCIICVGFSCHQCMYKYSRRWPQLYYMQAPHDIFKFVIITSLTANYSLIVLQ
jgi:hypothetical protein